MLENKNLPDLESQLETSFKNGLSSEEAQKRLLRDGENKLEEKKKKSVFRIFLEQLNNPMIFVLFAAIGITIGVSIYETIKVGFDFFNVGDWPDVIIILAVIILNGIIGTVQEVKAQSSLDALKKLASPESTVIRDGQRLKVRSSELVVGDVVVLEEGDTIGADLRLIEAINLKTNESSLTGESVSIEKDASVVFSDPVAIGDRVNCAYMSTPVVYGRGQGVVVSTGMKTEIGKIAKSLDEEEEEQTPLQKVLAKLSKLLGILTLLIVVVVLAADIIWIFIHGQGSDIEAWIEAVLASIALAVAAIPEGLAAVVTIVLSLGVQRMVKANTIVRKLPSVETLGAVSVVCSDKTGTLTQNKMTVMEAYVNDSFYKGEDFNDKQSLEELVLLGNGMSLCSNATVDEGLYGDPTEIALVDFSNKLGNHKGDLEKKQARIDELPFDSVRKMMSTLHFGEIQYTKGALDSILKCCDRILEKGKVRKLTKEDLEHINQANSNFSDRALRVLALAYDTNRKEVKEEKLVFVGLVAMIDPCRIEAGPAVAKFKQAGITTVMITGDHRDTAFAIAKELGIAKTKDQVLTGADVDALSFEELQKKCETVRVFARVSPENKVSIVKAFKANGNIAAMTGDGVNDAPSLKAADIGIAMGITGTDVAKGAADMVLTDDNFASIEKAVEEGRGIYANIKKTVLFLLSSNIAEVLGMFILICIGLPSPFIAIHLLWVNLITDSLPAVALGVDPKDPNNMNEKPRDPKENFFAHGGAKTLILYSVIITLGVVLAYFSVGWLNGAFSYGDIKALYESNPALLHEARSMAFATLAIAELIHMVGMSADKHHFHVVFTRKNWLMLVAFVAGFLLQVLVIEVPFVSKVFDTHELSGWEWLIVIGLSILPLIAHEIMVTINQIKNHRRNKSVKN